MTTTTRTWLAAALLSLAACSVSTEDLQPKDSSECAAGTKPCGYKCVSKLDPATGCGDPWSCQPCAGDAPYCDTTTYTCRTSPLTCTGSNEAQCDGAGACENLAADPNHCGLCGHFCGSGMSCINGICDPESMAAGNEARGILLNQNVLYWMDDWNGGRLMEWHPGDPFTSGYANERAWQLDPRPGSPAVFRIGANPYWPQLYFAGREGADDFTIYMWDASTGGTWMRIWGDVFSVADSRIEGLASAGAFVFFTRSDRLQPQVWDGSAAPWDANTATTASVRGLAGSGNVAYLGYGGASGGTLSFIDGTGAETVLASYSWLDAPHRIAVRQGPFLEFAWANEDTGNVWHWLQDGSSAPVRIHNGRGTPTQMDVAVDDMGVYWTDRADGAVWERRHDGTTLQLAKNVKPNGVAVDATFVYFTDGDGWVFRVPK